MKLFFFSLICSWRFVLSLRYIQQRLFFHLQITRRHFLLAFSNTPSQATFYFVRLSFLLLLLLLLLSSSSSSSSSKCFRHYIALYPPHLPSTPLYSFILITLFCKDRSYCQNIYDKFMNSKLISLSSYRNFSATATSGLP